MFSTKKIPPSDLRVVNKPDVMGPEQPTIFERLVGLLHLPYTVSCLILAFGVGFPGAIISYSLDGISLDQAVSRAFALSQSIPVWVSVVGEMLSTSGYFLEFYFIRYMRLKLVSTETVLLPILPQGEETLHRSFRLVTSKIPALAAILVLSLVYLLSFFFFGTVGSPNSPFTVTFQFVFGSITTLAFLTFLWVYFTSLLGLHQLGKEPIKFRSFYEDPMLGTRSFGSLSLSLAVAYLATWGGLSLSAFLVVNVGGLALYLLLSLVGAGLFFLPLWRIHRGMLREKQEESVSLRSRFIRLQSSSTPMSKDKESTLSDVEGRLAGVNEALVLEMEEKMLANVPTWPFDTRILGRLTIILLSVIAALISRLILFYGWHL